MDHKMTFDVSLHFTGTPVRNPGWRRGCFHLKRDVRVSCLPGLLPQFIEVDVDRVKIGDSLKGCGPQGSGGVALVDGGRGYAIVPVLWPRGSLKAVEPEAGEEGTKETEVLNKRYAWSKDRGLPMKLIVGLGNPGERYRVQPAQPGGFWLIRRAGRPRGITLSQKRFEAI